MTDPLKQTIEGDASGAVAAVEDAKAAVAGLPPAISGVAAATAEANVLFAEMKELVEQLHQNTRRLTGGIMAMSLAFGEGQSESAKMLREVSHLATAFILGGPVVGGIVLVVSGLTKLKEAMDEAAENAKTFTEAFETLGANLDARNNKTLITMQDHLTEVTKALTDFGHEGLEAALSLDKLNEAQQQATMAGLEDHIEKAKEKVADLKAQIAKGIDQGLGGGGLKDFAAYQAAKDELDVKQKILETDEKNAAALQKQLDISFKTVQVEQDLLKKTQDKTAAAAGKTAHEELLVLTGKLEKATRGWNDVMVEVVGNARLLGGVMANDEGLAKVGISLGPKPNQLVLPPMQAPAGVGVKQPQLDAYDGSDTYSSDRTYPFAHDASDEDYDSAAREAINNIKKARANESRDEIDAAKEAEKKAQEVKSANDDAYNAQIEAEQRAKDNALAYAKQMSAAVGGIGVSAVGGSGLAALGGVGGSAAGQAIGMATGLDPTGMASGAIGGALGAALGGLADKLQPLLDAGAELTKSFEDLFAVTTPVTEPILKMAQVFHEFADEVWEPFVQKLYAAAGPLVEIFADIVDMAMPFVGLFLELNPVVLLFTEAAYAMTPALRTLAVNIDNMAKTAYDSANQFITLANSLGAHLKPLTDTVDGPTDDCFVEGTPVATPRGAVAIDKLVAHVDDVYAYNIETGENEWCRVHDVHMRLASATIVIAFDDGSTVRTTESEPFLVSGTWRTAATLLPFDTIRSLDGAVRQIVGIRTDVGAMVWNLTVDRLHNYFVGAGQVLAHNGSKKKAALAAAKANAKALKENTAALTAQQNNLPPGFKYLASAFNAAPSSTIIHVNIGNPKDSIANEIQRLRNMASTNSSTGVGSYRGLGDKKG